MKKIFTLCLALMGFAGVANAAGVDDIAVCKHSYVLVCDQLGVRPGKGVLFGNDHFLDVTGGSTATNKGQVDLSVLNEADDNHVNQYIVDKYGSDYVGPHYNWLRLKNNQDVIAMKLTAKSKVIMFIQGNNKTGKDARIPCIAKSVDDIKNKTGLNAAPTADHPTTDAGFRWEYTVDDDGLYYFGSYNGDMFVSFIIVEANEAPGTPTVKIGDQTFEGGLWFREVTCKANDMVEEGSTEKIPTIVTYTTDGSAPTADSPIYKDPIKCYQNMTVKFQAFMDLGDGKPSADLICDGADNDGNVNFVFDAPTIEANGATFTITTPYAEQNGKNYYMLGDGEEVAGNGATLTESATVTAYTKIANGDYATFITKSTTKDVYVLNPIKEKKTIAVTKADVVLDEEATATSTTGEVYKVENGEISADKADFFVKNLSWGVVKDAQYQVDGKEAYIKMSDTNITFLVAAGDSVSVKVICSKNACKNIDAADAEDGSQVNDRKCYVNVSGTNYCHKDAEGNEAADLKLYPEANIIEFGLKGGKTTKQNKKDADGNDVLGEDGKAIQEEVFTPGDTYYTFQKYSGTGNILISSIEIEPAAAEPATLDLMDKFTGLWNGAETQTHNADGTITYNGKQWGGLSAWLGEEDWSAYDQLVFEFAEATPCAVQPFLQYVNSSDNFTNWTNAGATKAFIDLDPALKNAVKQAALQPAEDCTLTITKIYLSTGSTGIENVKVVNVNNGAIYNLAGQKVGADYKGLVIKNGKKLVVK